MESKTILRALSGEAVSPPPLWLMRQAGRYLPEYRATREQAGGFLDLCYNPELAEEVTLQPIRRYDFDAAILFADILLIPQALGQELWFATGEGPRLTPVTGAETLKPVDEIHETLNPVYETVARLSRSLPDRTTLIGFAGAPWTVATYMIAGRGTPDQAPAKALMRENPDAFDKLIDLVADATIAYLSKQIDAGAEVVKLFDSWAGSLAGDEFERACVRPAIKIVEALRSLHPNTPIIGFPRGVGDLSVRYVEATGVDCVAFDQAVDPVWARDHLQGMATVQGNLDPGLLLKRGDEMRRAVDHLIETLGQGPFIFNLGHGVTPDVSPDAVEELVGLVRGAG